MKKIMKILVITVLIAFSVSMLSGCGIVTLLMNRRSEESVQEKARTEDEVSENISEEAPETNMPEKTAEINLVESMSNAEKKEINIFLSNFSEAGYGEGNYGSEAEEKISFAYIHNFINNSSLVFRDGGAGVYGISAANADQTLVRFFGESVPHATPENSVHWQYENGKFFFPAADGDNYATFSVATRMTDNYDGTFTVEFNTYNDKDPFEWPKSEWYTYTDEYAARTCDFAYSGTAIVKEKVYNGSQTYELVDYKIM